MIKIIEYHCINMQKKWPVSDVEAGLIVDGV